MNSEEQAAKELAALKKYLETRKVVIADPGITSRAGMYKLMQEFGAKNGSMGMASTFQDALEMIQKNKPHVVLAEYEMGKRCGLDLIQYLREQHPKEMKNCIFIIITGNTSQSAVAKSAEEDVDAFIIKPFTREIFRKTILKAALQKIKPSDYSLVIEEGKKLLEEGKINEAHERFEKAKELDRNPSLAFYYSGQAEYLKEIMDKAKSNYEGGLGFNRIHYKCLVGLYDLLMKQKEHIQAYEIVKRIAQYFPANPKRLAEVLKLAIMIGKYEDIEKYYSLFVNIEERNEELVRYMCAALVICGKHYLQTNQAHNRAFELFRKAAVSSSSRASVLKEIVLVLSEHKMTIEASFFLERFATEARLSDEFLLCQYLVNDMKSGKKVLAEGQELLKKGIVNDRLYWTLIRRIMETGSVVVAKEVLEQAVKNIPHKKELFEQALNYSESTKKS